MATINPTANNAAFITQAILQEAKNNLASKIHDYVKSKGIRGNFEWNANGDIYQNDRIVMHIEDPAIKNQIAKYIKFHQALSAPSTKDAPAASSRAPAPQEPPKTSYSSLPNHPSPPASLFAQNTPPQEPPTTSYSSLPNHPSPPASLYMPNTPQQRSPKTAQTPSQTTQMFSSQSSLIEKRYLKEKRKNLKHKLNQLFEDLKAKKTYKDSDKIGRLVTQLTRGWVNDYTTLDQEIETIESEIRAIQAERSALFNILSLESNKLSLRVEAMILEEECLEKNQIIKGCDIHFGTEALKPLKVAHLSFSELAEKGDHEINTHIQALKSTLEKINQRIAAIATLNDS